ncbi:MAG TPA: hypothetical protein VF339_13470 [Gammaproteobacteria bacterium]
MARWTRSNKSTTAVPAFRCDFLVSGDLSLERSLEEINDHGHDGFRITFRDAPKDEQGHASGLVAIVIGEAESMEDAERRLRNALEHRLDLLTFVTHSRFKIRQALRLIEWEAGKKTRQLRVFHRFDPRYPPVPELASDILATVHELEKSGLPRFLRLALRYFRYGLFDEHAEDQFLRLWLSLEIIAENLKDRARVAITCPKCREPLTCGHCKSEPKRTPFGRQAIEALIGKVSSDMDNGAAERLLMARNKLMHGASRKSTESACKKSMSDLVDELGTIVWRVILTTIPLEAQGPQLAFYEPAYGRYVNSNMLLWSSITFDHDGDGPHPADVDIPDAKLEVLTRFAAANQDPRG